MHSSQDKGQDGCHLPGKSRPRDLPVNTLGQSDGFSNSLTEALQPHMKLLKIHCTQIFHLSSKYPSCHDEAPFPGTL